MKIIREHIFYKGYYKGEIIETLVIYSYDTGTYHVSPQRYDYNVTQMDRKQMKKHIKGLTFQHKVRECLYYWSDDLIKKSAPNYCGDKEIYINLFKKEWGCAIDEWGYNGALPLDKNVLYKEYNQALREMKLKRILK
jgi:hypothetical protein